MARIWANRLEAGNKLWSNVPDYRKPGVKDVLMQDVADGRITAERYKEICGEKYPETEQVK